MTWELLEVIGFPKPTEAARPPSQALKQASFSVPRGEFVAVVGESGSRKEYAPKPDRGLDTPTAGRYTSTAGISLL